MVSLLHSTRSPSLVLFYQIFPSTNNKAGSQPQTSDVYQHRSLSGGKWSLWQDEWIIAFPQHIIKRAVSDTFLAFLRFSFAGMWQKLKVWMDSMLLVKLLHKNVYYRLQVSNSYQWGKDWFKVSFSVVLNVESMFQKINNSKMTKQKKYQKV